MDCRTKISWDKGYEFHGDKGKHAYGHYVMLQQLEHTISYCAIAQETSYRKYFDKRAFCVFRDSHAHCVSGKNKLIAGLPTDIKFGHKTGRSNRTADGIQISEEMQE